MAIADDCKAHSAGACCSIYAKGCNTASTATIKPKVYSTEGREKRCAHVVALDNTTSIICALRLVIISVFSPSRPSWT